MNAQKDDTKAMIEVRGGEVVLQEVGLPFSAEKVKIALAGQAVSAKVSKSQDGIVVSLVEPVCVSAGEMLTIIKQ